MSFFAQLIEAQRKRNRYPRKKKPIEKVNPHHQKDIFQGRCNRLVGCGKPVKISDFRDETSKKEFDITGLCQQCQNKLFGE